jgi:hypothetical protein
VRRRGKRERKLRRLRKCGAACICFTHLGPKRQKMGSTLTAETDRPPVATIVAPVDETTAGKENSSGEWLNKG